MKYPKPIKPGSKIAIVSPATIVKEEYVNGAADHLRRRGYQPVIMPSACGPASGSYAASVPARLADLLNALTNPEIDAILCARGGYGSVHLLPEIPVETITNNPKWLIGFSDISALHALWQKAGLVSLHAPMAKHLTLMGADDPCTTHLFELLTAAEPKINYEIPPCELDQHGQATGILRGGNLAVLSHLIATPWDTLTPADDEDVILFIEDVGEAIYATERMLWQLHLSGALAGTKGIIVGAFTEAKPDRNYPDTATMIAARLRQWGYRGPVAARFPAGHIDDNHPLPLGARVTLTVGPAGTTLSQ